MRKVFSLLFGAFLGLALLKFGNPVILDQLIERPTEALEFLYSPWPLKWGQTLLAGLAVFGLAIARFKLLKPLWLSALLIVWFFWQLLSATQTIDTVLTRITLMHFATCIVCFGIGGFALGRSDRLVGFGAGLLPFFLWMLWMGFEQHYGGLEATERMIRETPNWQQVFPPEYLERIARKRVFATLVYPNALAGVILLLAPLMMEAVWRLSSRLTVPSRSVIVGTVGYGAAACLIWTGSKSGWLIALVLGVVALLHCPFPKKAKWIAAIAVSTIGLAIFSVKFASYFQKGATSVGARLTYWNAAWQTAKEHPVLGSGPGTFGKVYAQIKPPEAEMARLVHNDYLEQATDSGWIGLLAYVGFWFGLIGWAYRKAVRSSSRFQFACWIGLLGWCLQGFSEFGLYVPALSWAAFALAGWLGARIGIDMAIERG